MFVDESRLHLLLPLQKPAEVLLKCLYFRFQALFR